MYDDDDVKDFQSENMDEEFDEESMDLDMPKDTDFGLDEEDPDRDG